MLTLTRQPSYHEEVGCDIIEIINTSKTKDNSFNVGGYINIKPPAIYSLSTLYNGKYIEYNFIGLDKDKSFGEQDLYLISSSIHKSPNWTFTSNDEFVNDDKLARKIFYPKGISKFLTAVNKVNKDSNISYVVNVEYIFNNVLKRFYKNINKHYKKTNSSELYKKYLNEFLVNVKSYIDFYDKVCSDYGTSVKGYSTRGEDYDFHASQILEVLYNKVSILLDNNGVVYESDGIFQDDLVEVYDVISVLPIYEDMLFLYSNSDVFRTAVYEGVLTSKHLQFLINTNSFNTSEVFKSKFISELISSSNYKTYSLFDYRYKSITEPFYKIFSSIIETGVDDLHVKLNQLDTRTYPELFALSYISYNFCKYDTLYKKEIDEIEDKEIDVLISSIEESLFEISKIKDNSLTIVESFINEVFIDSNIKDISNKYGLPTLSCELVVHENTSVLKLILNYYEDEDDTILIESISVSIVFDFVLLDTINRNFIIK